MSSFVTIVSGLPRSGTSLMMHMLSAGGMPVLTDGIRVPDEDNPRGYFEFEPVKRTKTDPAWLADAEGKAVKMVYLLLRDLPQEYEYRVIMMRRDVNEVLASQRKMLQRSGRAGANVTAERLAEIYQRELKTINEWLASQPNFLVHEANHGDCLSKPREVAAQIRDFLGMDLDEERMAGVIDPSLYRNQRRGPGGA